MFRMGEFHPKVLSVVFAMNFDQHAELLGVDTKFNTHIVQETSNLHT